MRRTWKLLVTAAVALGSAPDLARAALAPNGDTVWAITTDSLFVTIESLPNQAITMTLTDRSNGGSISANGLASLFGPGTYEAQAVFEVNSYYGFMRLGVPGPSPIGTDVDVSLVDNDGVAFAGLPSPGPPPVNPPPLALFETAVVGLPVITCGGHDLSVCSGNRLTQQIRVLPESGVTSLLLGPLALLGLKRKRAPEA